MSYASRTTREHKTPESNKSVANMCGSKAVKKAIRNCIVKTSNWGCSKVRMQDVHKIHEIHPPNWRGHGCPQAGV